MCCCGRSQAEAGVRPRGGISVAAPSLHQASMLGRRGWPCGLIGAHDRSRRGSRRRTATGPPEEADGAAP